MTDYESRLKKLEDEREEIWIRIIALQNDVQQLQGGRKRKYRRKTKEAADDCPPAAMLGLR